MPPHKILPSRFSHTLKIKFNTCFREYSPDYNYTGLVFAFIHSFSTLPLFLLSPSALTKFCLTFYKASYSCSCVGRSNIKNLARTIFYRFWGDGACILLVFQICFSLFPQFASMSALRKKIGFHCSRLFLSLSWGRFLDSRSYVAYHI